MRLGLMFVSFHFGFNFLYSNIDFFLYHFLLVHFFMNTAWWPKHELNLFLRFYRLACKHLTLLCKLGYSHLLCLIILWYMLRCMLNHLIWICSPISLWDKHLWSLVSIRHMLGGVLNNVICSPVQLFLVDIFSHFTKSALSCPLLCRRWWLLLLINLFLSFSGAAFRLMWWQLLFLMLLLRFLLLGRPSWNFYI